MAPNRTVLADQLDAIADVSREMEGATKDVRLGLDRLARLLKDSDLPDAAREELDAAIGLLHDEILGGYLHVASVAIEQAQREAQGRAAR